MNDLAKTEPSEVRKYNAVRHGVLTKVLLPDETEEAKTVEAQLINEYQPKSLTENLLIETLAISYIRRQRAINKEREYIMQLLNPAVYEDKVITPPVLDNPPIGDSLSGIKQRILIKPAYYAQISPTYVDIIDKTFGRYINTCERQFFRALHELQRIQSIRKGLRPTSVAVDFISEGRGDD